MTAAHIERGFHYNLIHTKYTRKRFSFNREREPHLAYFFILMTKNLQQKNIIIVLCTYREPY